VGGRVRSDLVDGFVCDRGFQVYFTAYPAGKRHLDYARLDFRRYEPGAIVCRAAKRSVLSDPLRDFGSAIPAVLSPVVPFADKLRTLKLTAEVKSKSIDAIMDGPDETTEAFLQKRDFSEAFLDNFVRPFFGGIFLEDRLQTSAKAFQFDWKMLSEGETVVPAKGMGQISLQLADELNSANRISLKQRVTRLLRAVGGQVVGVQTEDGNEWEADTVVLSVPAPEAERLCEVQGPKGQNSVVTLYFAGDAPVWNDKKIYLNGNARPFVNNAAMATNVAPTYAPPGKHLLAASVLGTPEGSDGELFDRTLADLRRMLTGDKAALQRLSGYRPLTLYRIPYGQFPQPPGVYPTLPDNHSHPGLLFAAEWTTASSLNAAMRSGEKAAQWLLG
jgi:protoporphyrinogen oxidase